MTNNTKLPAPTWLFCVWKDKMYPKTFFQVDMIDAAGRNAASTNPDELRAAGYAIPDLSWIKHGQFSFAQINATLALLERAA